MTQNTFETHQHLDGMQPCMKKPIVVHCLQISEPFRVKSLEGDYAQGKAGDYLMRGIQGELYICDREVFERSYDLQQVESKPERRCSMNCKPGECIASGMGLPHQCDRRDKHPLG